MSLSKNINPSLVLVQPSKTCPFITERLLMGRKESNQTNKQTMLSLDLSCLENSVNPDQLASEKPANPDAHCFYPPTKSEGYSFGVVRPSVRPSVHSVRPSVRLSGTISQYLLVGFDSFLVQMISTMDSQTSNKFGQNQPLNT